MMVEGSASSPRGSEGPSSVNTFTFADLAGFTALTEAHGDQHAADLAGHFAAGMREIASEHGGEAVKAIGDAVMLRNSSRVAMR